MIDWEKGKLGELKKAGLPIPPTFVVTEATDEEITEAYTTITIHERSAAQEFMEEKEETVVIKNSETYLNIKGKEKVLEIIKKLEKPVTVQVMIKADKTGTMEIGEKIIIKGSLGIKIKETDEYEVDKDTYEIKETINEQHKKTVLSEGELTEKTINEKHQKINDKEIREITRQGKKASKYGVTKITWCLKKEEVFILKAE